MPVQRVVERLAHLRVVERRLADIHADQRVAQVWHLGRDDARCSGQRVDGDRVHRGEELVGAAGQAGLARAGFRHDVELEPGHLGQAGHVVVGVLYQAHIGIGDPLVELERTGADRCLLQFGRFGDGLGRHDGQGGELAYQRQRRRVQRDQHIALVVHDVLDHRQAAGVGRCGLAVLHALERSHHVGGTHDLAVVELDVGLELEAVAQAVLGYGPCGRQRGHHLEVLVDRGQALVDGAGDQHRVEGRHHMGIQACRRAVHGDLEHLRGGQSGPQQTGEREAEPGWAARYSAAGRFVGNSGHVVTPAGIENCIRLS